MGDIPADFDDVTAAWLNDNTDLGGTVDRVEIERIGEGFGMISLIGRASLGYAHGDGPASVVVKLASPIPELVAMAQLYGFYQREVDFYRHAAALVPNAAAAHHVDIRDDAGTFVIVMEDMSALRMADQIVGCTPDDARAAIDAMADLHVQFWDNEALAAQTWLPPANNPMYLQAEEQYQQFFPAFMERYGDGLSANSRQVAADLQTRVKALQHLAAGDEGQTLAHFDLRLDNLLFSERGVHILDWQLSIRAVGAVDVAYFLGWSMQNDQRRALTDELIGRYHDRLVGHGIAGYSRAQCEDHVRRSLLGVAMMAAYGSVAVPASNDRGQALLDAMVERTFSAVDDLGSAEFMPD